MPRIEPDSQGVGLLQEGLSRELGKLQRGISNGVLTEPITMVAGTNVVYHSLGQVPSGFVPVWYDQQYGFRCIVKDSRTMTIVSSGTVTTTLWVF